MSAKHLKYSHAAYCAKRVQEVDTPKAIPVPKNMFPNLNKILPIKGVKHDEESDDDEAYVLKDSIMASGDTEINAMTK